LIITNKTVESLTSSLCVYAHAFLTTTYIVQTVAEYAEHQSDISAAVQHPSELRA